MEYLLLKENKLKRIRLVAMLVGNTSVKHNMLVDYRKSRETYPAVTRMFGSTGDQSMDNTVLSCECAFRSECVLPPVLRSNKRIDDSLKPTAIKKVQVTRTKKLNTKSSQIVINH